MRREKALVMYMTGIAWFYYLPFLSPFYASFVRNMIMVIFDDSLGLSMLQVILTTFKNLGSKLYLKKLFF